MSDTFRTLASARRMEMRVQGSRFIATARPARDAAEARAGIDAIASEFPDATHHCWAYRVAAERGGSERAHDAGEPAGTAGPPILQAIRGAGLLNVLVVVTRYFGGTRLGKGGLARAYRAAARAVLDGAEVIEETPRAERRIVGPVERDGELRHLVARLGGTITGATYEDSGRAVLSIRVPVEALADLGEGVRAVTHGAARLENAEEVGGPAAKRRG